MSYSPNTIYILDVELLFEQAAAFCSQHTVCHHFRQRVGKCDQHLSGLVYHCWTKDLQRKNMLLSFSIGLTSFSQFALLNSIANHLSSQDALNRKEQGINLCTYFWTWECRLVSAIRCVWGVVNSCRINNSQCFNWAGIQCYILYRIWYLKVRREKNTSIILAYVANCCRQLEWN